VSARAPLKSIRCRLDRDQLIGHEGSILRYAFLVGVLVKLQAHVYPFTMMVLK
jgi:hypothetical protein